MQSKITQAEMKTVVNQLHNVVVKEAEKLMASGVPARTVGIAVAAFSCEYFLSKLTASKVLEMSTGPFEFSISEAIKILKGGSRAEAETRRVFETLKGKHL